MSPEPSAPGRPDNLPELLIEAGITLLAEHGAAGLTLRRAAALAGVSHAAPAHHFRGLPGLQAAIARRGFEMFLQVLTETQKDAPLDPFDRLMQTNQAYLDFARRHDALFQLMFNETDHGSPEMMQVAMLCYEVLRQNCAPFAQTPAEAGLIESAVWALTHGYATLRMQDQRPNAPEPPPSYESMMRLLLRLDAAEA